MDSLLHDLLCTLLPSEIHLHFELVCVVEEKDRIVLHLEEYAELTPSSLSSSGNVVLDGFCNPLELLNFPLRDKPTYLKIYRRRWKESGSDKHYSNTYNLHPDGVKATHSFASFLKDEVRLTPDEYLRSFLGFTTG